MKTLLLVLVFSVQAFAQVQPDQSAPPAQPYQQPVQQQRMQPLPIRRSASDLLDPFQPGWQTQKVHYGIGYGSSLLNGGSGGFIFDKYDNNGGYSIFLGFAKQADNFQTQTEVDVAGTSTTTTTTTQQNSGQRNPFTLNIGASYNRPIFRNDWLMVRWGVYGGVSYAFKTTYDTGSHTEAVDNSTGNVTVTDSSRGTTTATFDPTFTLGPVIDSFFFVRWFPHLAIGLQGGMLYTTPSKVTYDTSSLSQNYQVIGGASQTPTSYTQAKNRTVSDQGSSMNTFAVNGADFSLLGNFVLRYVW